jgi:hypothetical protein
MSGSEPVLSFIPRLSTSSARGWAGVICDVVDTSACAPADADGRRESEAESPSALRLFFSFRPPLIDGARLWLGLRARPVPVRITLLPLTVGVSTSL